MTTTKATIIERLEAHIAAECNEVDREKAFDDYLDEVYDFKQVGGPFAYMSPSRVLLEIDPIAHRCGVNDYADGLNLIEIGDCYYESREVEKARDSFLDELDSEISDLETVLGELRDDEDASPLRVASMERQILDLKEDHKAAESHTF